MTPAQFWQIEMQNQQGQREQQQQNQENIMQGLNDIAGVYMEQENMKASVKAGDNLLKVLGPGIGMTEDMLKQMDYGKMPMREKYAFQQGILKNYAVAAQTQNFGQSLGVRQAGQQLARDRPFIDASLKNLGNTAAGNVPFSGSPSQDPANTVPLPTGPSAPVDQAPGATAPQVPSMPGGQASRDLLNRDRARRGLPPI
jgi:hypothetical protein